MIKIIKEKKEWDLTLEKVGDYDVYHTYDYHNLSKKDDECPVLLYYTYKKYRIAFPFIMRPIENSEYWDATSVYGYAGPISKNLDDSFCKEDFQSEFINYLKQNNIVSFFSRLHPFINLQKTILSDIGHIQNKGKVVYFDLRGNEEDLKNNYQKRLRTEINKLRRECTIYKVTSKDAIDRFIAIYYANMDRVKASPEYYFNSEYFHLLMRSKQFKTEIFLIEENKSKEIAGGGILFMTNNYAQYHLSGTDSVFLKLSPTKLLIDEMRIESKKQGLQFFNLGGGLSTKWDSLFHFKSLFSNSNKSFQVWNYIVNQEIYQDLVSKKKNIKNSDFFPLYRG